MKNNNFNQFGTKKRLTEWGNWCNYILTGHMDYSRQSIISKLQQDGGMIISGTAKLLVPTNEKAEEVNECIEQLALDAPDGQGKPNWAKVIRIHYTMRDQDMRTKLRVSALSKRTYYRYLQSGEDWVAQHLY